MTNGVGSSTIGSAYANNIAKNSGTKVSENSNSDKGLENKTKVDQIKSQIESGNYKIDIDKLAKKMAEELIS